ncbi:hypothetical protein [Enterobacter cloacae complex sp. 288G10]|uniref:hypothetical protein n=1 Tax=Enterobacter cloacae complex sp. 288G10 TaxID=3395859 RepID=UPI003CF8BE1A
MQKLKLIILPVLAFVWPSINATASTKTPMPTSQQSVAKSEANYEFISISAKYVDGMWLVNGQQRPVIKTSMTKRNSADRKSVNTYAFEPCDTQNCI